MHEIFELVRHIAGTKSTVLIEGETGTGKELIAKAVHYSSEDRQGNLVAVNCAALPENAAGERAVRPREGRVHLGRRPAARGGSSWPTRGRSSSTRSATSRQAMQAKLLRVLQEKRFERVGGHESIEVDVRVVAATNKNLEKEVKEGRFREDLYLPAQRDQDRRAAAARAARGHPAAGHALPEQVRPAQRAAQEDLARGDGAAAGVPLAGQHPRAGERHRAGRRDDRRRHDRAREAPAAGHRRRAAKSGPGSRST